MILPQAPGSTLPVVEMITTKTPTPAQAPTPVHPAPKEDLISSVKPTPPTEPAEVVKTPERTYDEAAKAVIKLYKKQGKEGVLRMLDTFLPGAPTLIALKPLAARRPNIWTEVIEACDG